jgi:hypothetical protein
MWLEPGAGSELAEADAFNDEEDDDELIWARWPGRVRGGWKRTGEAVRLGSPLLPPLPPPLPLLLLLDTVCPNNLGPPGMGETTVGTGADNTDEAVIIGIAATIDDDDVEEEAEGDNAAAADDDDNEEGGDETLMAGGTMALVELAVPVPDTVRICAREGDRNRPSTAGAWMSGTAAGKRFEDEFVSEETECKEDEEEEDEVLLLFPAECGALLEAAAAAVAAEGWWNVEYALACVGDVLTLAGAEMAPAAAASGATGNAKCVSAGLVVREGPPEVMPL